MEKGCCVSLGKSYDDLKCCDGLGGGFGRVYEDLVVLQGSFGVFLWHPGTAGSPLLIVLLFV